MKMIVGLGNPEKDYKGTRHNAGFEVINKLAYDFNIEINKAKFRAHYGKGQILNQQVLLVKPQTYMNLSGECVRDMLNFYKLSIEDLLVIYDDTSLPVGDIRIRQEGSAGGHNGIKNIIYQLETTKFDRVKIGIGEKPKGWDLADYVLSRFKPNEMESIIEGYTKAGDAVALIVKEGIVTAMNKFNSKIKSSEG